MVRLNPYHITSWTLQAYHITFACCGASRRIWACQGHLQEKMVRSRRWSGANSCIPQHILDRLVSSNYKFLNTTCLQSQKEVKKKILHYTDALIAIRLQVQFGIMYLWELYLAKPPPILPLQAGSRNPYHLWCLSGRTDPVSPVASQWNFRPTLQNVIVPFHI